LISNYFYLRHAHFLHNAPCFPLKVVAGSILVI
jgi:hypothetical protein